MVEIVFAQILKMFLLASVMEALLGRQTVARC